MTSLKRCKGFVVHDLYPRVRADHEHFSTMHDAGMDEDSFACGDFANAEAFVDKPLVDDKLHGFGLVTESFLQVGFTYLLSSIARPLLSVPTCSVYWTSNLQSPL